MTKCHASKQNPSGPTLEKTNRVCHYTLHLKYEKYTFGNFTNGDCSAIPNKIRFRGEVPWKNLCKERYDVIEIIDQEYILGIAERRTLHCPGCKRNLNTTYKQLQTMMGWVTMECGWCGIRAAANKWVCSCE